MENTQHKSKSLLTQKRNLLMLIGPLGLVIYEIARNNPEIAENVFAKNLYRHYSQIMSHVTGLLPFSLAEILLIAFAVGLSAWLITGVVRIAIGKGRRLFRLVRFLRGIVIIAGVVFTWYVIGCGTNYYRYEFSEYSGLTIEKSTTEELYELCAQLAEDTNEARERLCGLGSAPVYMNNSERSEASVRAMKTLAKEYPVLETYYPGIKPVFFSRVMSRFEITGVYFPWTVEANVNVDIPDYSITSTMCHELSHLTGFMREDEANFIAYLACIASDNPELNYSGTMLALINAGNRLYSDSPELYYEITALYSEGVKEDLKNNSLYWKQFENTVLSETGEKMNDTYLKANNQTDGTKSYGRMVDLLLALQRKN